MIISSTNGLNIIAYDELPVPRFAESREESSQRRAAGDVAMWFMDRKAVAHYKSDITDTLDHQRDWGKIKASSFTYKFVGRQILRISRDLHFKYQGPPEGSGKFWMDDITR